MLDPAELLNRVHPRLWKPYSDRPSKQDGKRPDFDFDRPPVLTAREKLAVEIPTCDECRDQGFIMVELVDKSGNVARTEMRRCSCQEDTTATRLAKIDGILPHERDIAFEYFEITPSLQKVLPYLINAVNRRQGFITLYGDDVGTGKSALLKAAVNKARESRRTSAYRRTSHLLQELRNQFDEDGNFQARWDILINAAVLAVDEIDKWQQKDWSIEKFDDLIDDRYRRLESHLTILAGNTLDHLTAYNRSRFNDSQARIFHIEGADVRREER